MTRSSGEPLLYDPDLEATVKENRRKVREVRKQELNNKNQEQDISEIDNQELECKKIKMGDNNNNQESKTLIEYTTTEVERAYPAILRPTIATNNF